MIGNILITGGTGTLGHAIVRAALADAWQGKITIFSRSELRQAQMRARYPHLSFVLGDVRDYSTLAAAMAGQDIVIHGAAMKRIPEAEAQPVECVAVNVVGSANVARACINAGVPLCIGISTDKACRASTTYGASKLLLEGLWRAQAEAPTRFVLCRYGNVLGSNGSVLELWARQAAQGEALTLTDPACTRFWMSEAEAVRVIERAARLRHGQVYIPKMGALNIADMAQMLYPGHDVRAIGLRAMEKHHEDLIHPDERACDYSGYYVLSTDGTIGHEYRSDTARRIGAAELRQMIAEGA